MQHIQIRKGGFVKPDNKTQPNSIRMATTNFFMSFSCHPEKYLTQRRILKLFTFLSRRQQRKFVQYKASP